MKSAALQTTDSFGCATILRPLIANVRVRVENWPRRADTAVITQSRRNPVPKTWQSRSRNGPQGDLLEADFWPAPLSVPSGQFRLKAGSVVPKAIRIRSASCMASLKRGGNDIPEGLSLIAVSVVSRSQRSFSQR